MDGNDQITGNENTDANEAEEQPRKIRFLNLDGLWYFAREGSEPIGPFDRIYDTILTEWRNTERVLSGDKMSQVLAPYAQ